MVWARRIDEGSRRKHQGKWNQRLLENNSVKGIHNEKVKADFGGLSSPMEASSTAHRQTLQ